MLRVFVACFVILLLFFTVQKMISGEELHRAWEDFPKLLFIPILFLSCLVSFTKASRFFFILRGHGVDLPFMKTVRLFVASQATSALPAGEAMRGWLVKQESDEEIKNLFAPVVLQMIYEVGSAMVIACTGSLFFRPFLLPMVIATSVLALIVVLITYENGLKKVIKRIPLAAKHAHNLTGFSSSIKKSIHTPRLLATNLSLAIATQISLGFILYLIARGFAVHLSLFSAIFIAALSIVFQTIGGVIPGGLGITEGGMSGVFLAFGTPLKQSIPIVLIFRLVTLVFFILTGLCVFIIFYAKIFFKPQSRITPAT